MTRRTRLNPTLTRTDGSVTYARKLKDLFPFTDAPRTVMASPPTLTWSTVNPITPYVQHGYNATTLTMEGGYPRDNATYSFRENGVNGTTSGGQQFAFDYWGQDFAFQVRSFDTGGGAYWVEIDGQLTAATPFLPSGVTPSVGLTMYCRVQFASRALRRIRIWQSGAQWQGILINRTDAVAPVKTGRRKLLVYGDSFVGIHAGGADQLLMATELGRILGMEVANCGKGGTGYGVGAAGPYDDATRLGLAAAWNPDAIVVFGTINNDATAATASAASAVYASFAASCPNAPVLVVGPAMLHTGTVPANRVTSQANVKTAALAAPNVIGHVDPIAGIWTAADGRTGGGGAQWVTGTGCVGATTGQGPDDYFVSSDNTHPQVPEGDHYLARRIANDLYQIVNGVV